MPNPGSFADTLKQQADIVRVVGDYVKLKKSGAQNFSGLCPFHKEKTPSFSVHATRQFYHCFGCGVSGDVFSFVQKVENVTFPEAVRAVAEKLGVPMPKQQYSGPAEAQEAKLRGVLLDMHERACAFFQEQLRKPEGARAREYLVSRGLSDDISREFRIGYAPDSGFLLRDRLRGEFSEEHMKAAGLFSWKQTEEENEPRTKSQKPIALYSKFRNRITFPIANDAGKIIAFTGRTLATDEKSGPKYLNSPETAIYSKSRVLFNLDKAREAIRKLDYAIVVEGQMDCISVYAAGFKNVIASSGTAFTELQARLLGRFSKKIVVNFDPDAAGAAATQRTLALLVSEDFEIKVLTLEPGLDPDLFIRRRGRDAYAEALRTSQKYFDYLIERARSTFRVKTPEGKVAAVKFLLPHVHQVSSRIARAEIANEIAQKLDIDSDALRQELRHAAATRTAQVSTPVEAQLTASERIIVRALATSGDILESNALRPQSVYTLTNERLHDGLATESLINALLAAEVDTAFDPLSLVLPDSERRLLASILMDEDEPLTPELLSGAFDALRRRTLERQIRQIKAQIAEAERRQDTATLARLMQEKVRIDRELSSH